MRALPPPFFFFFTSLVEVWEVLCCVLADQAGAEVNTKDSIGRASLQLASAEGKDEWIYSRVRSQVRIH